MQSSIDSFVSRVNALSANLPLHIRIAVEIHIHVNRQLQEFLDRHCVTPSPPDAPLPIKSHDEGSEDAPRSPAVPTGPKIADSQEYIIPIDKIQTFRVLKDELDRLDIVCKALPELALIALASQLDVYLASLIRGMLMIKPEILNASERTITYSELSKFATLEEAREYFTEKTIENVLRQSLSDQFSWLEEKLGFQLRKGLEKWPSLIEISQRRNLFVHADGIVSGQYLDECRKNKFPLDENVRKGTQLNVSPAYIETARAVALEVGIKLGYVIWKGLAPTLPNEELADNHLNNIAVELITRKDAELALRLLSFPQENGKPKFSSQLFVVLFGINKALILRKTGKKKEALAIVESIEWRMLSEKFQMAKLVLEEKFEEAAQLMKKLGPRSDMINELNYLQWPILEEFRKTPHFQSAFKEVFTRDFTEFSPHEVKRRVLLSV